MSVLTVDEKRTYLAMCDEHARGYSAGFAYPDVDELLSQGLTEVIAQQLCENYLFAGRASDLYWLHVQRYIRTVEARGERVGKFFSQAQKKNVLGLWRRAAIVEALREMFTGHMSEW